MTKADIVERIADATRVTRKQSAELLDQFFELLKKTLESGDTVKISGFGNFSVRQKADRRGRNPQTGAEIVVKQRKVVVFKASQVLRERVKG